MKIEVKGLIIERFGGFVGLVLRMVEFWKDELA